MKILESYMQSYLKASARGFENTFSVQFHIAKDKNKNLLIHLDQGLLLSKKFVVHIPFSGAVSGDFFLALDEKNWKKFVKEIFSMDADSELTHSAAKELLNTVVGDAIEPINKDFPGLTYSAPRIIKGDIDYPKVTTMRGQLEHKKYGVVEVVLALDLMQQEIGSKLAKEIDKVIEQKKRAKTAERTIRSILGHVNLGLCKLNSAAKIMPGCSTMLASLFFKPLEQIIEHPFVDSCPPEVLGDKKQAWLEWFTKVQEYFEAKEKNWDELIKENPLSKVEFQKEGQDYVYFFSFFPMLEQEEKGLLLIVEDITERSLLEKNLLTETASKVELEGKMQVAHAIQNALLPKAMNFDLFEMGVSYKPAEEVGGDWFGYHYDRQREIVDIYMGDVTGHGVGAAILTAVTCGSVYSLEKCIDEQKLSLNSEQRIDLVANILDKVIGDIGQGKRLMSMVFLSVELKTGKLSYLNAGHQPCFVIRKDKEIVETIIAPGSLLGAQDKFEVAKKSLQLEAGDLVFTYTDGLVENQGPEGTTLKLKKLRNCLVGLSSVNEAVKKVLSQAEAVWQEEAGEDDVAILSFSWKGKKA